MFFHNNQLDDQVMGNGDPTGRVDVRSGLRMDRDSSHKLHLYLPARALKIGFPPRLDFPGPNCPYILVKHALAVTTELVAMVLTSRGHNTSRLIDPPRNLSEPPSVLLLLGNNAVQSDFQREVSTRMHNRWELNTSAKVCWREYSDGVTVISR